MKEKRRIKGGGRKERKKTRQEKRRRESKEVQYSTENQSKYLNSILLIVYNHLVRLT